MMKRQPRDPRASEGGRSCTSSTVHGAFDGEAVRAAEEEARKSGTRWSAWPCSATRRRRLHGARPDLWPPALQSALSGAGLELVSSYVRSPRCPSSKGVPEEMKQAGCSRTSPEGRRPSASTMSKRRGDKHNWFSAAL